MFFFYLCVCVSIFSFLFANCSRSSFLYSYDETVTTGETIGTYCSGLRGQLTKIQKVLKYFHHKYFWYTAIYFQQIVTGLLSWKPHLNVDLQFFKGISRYFTAHRNLNNLKCYSKHKPKSKNNFFLFQQRMSGWFVRLSELRPQKGGRSVSSTV